MDRGGGGRQRVAVGISDRHREQGDRGDVKLRHEHRGGRVAGIDPSGDVVAANAVTVTVVVEGVRPLRAALRELHPGVRISCNGARSDLTKDRPQLVRLRQQRGMTPVRREGRHGAESDDSDDRDHHDHLQHTETLLT